MCDPDPDDDDWDRSRWELRSDLDAMSSIEVAISDNPVVGTLFDPSGGVLLEVLERPTVPFGFRR